MRILIADAAEWGPEHLALNFPCDVGGWIRGAFRGAPAEYLFWRVQREDAPPPPDAYDAVVVGGSPASVYDGHPWIARLEDRIRDWTGRGVPLLGICFGHQAVASALGGEVRKNPKGWEVGTCFVNVTGEGKSDPLMKGLPPVVPVLQSHQDVVVKPPAGSVVLAGNGKSEYQALAIGARVRTIQFHPEFTPNRLRFMIGPRKERLSSAGVDVEAVLENLRETPETLPIMQNFLDAFVRANPRGNAARKRD